MVVDKTGSSVKIEVEGQISARMTEAIGALSYFNPGAKRNVPAGSYACFSYPLDGPPPPEPSFEFKENTTIITMSRALHAYLTKGRFKNDTNYHYFVSVTSGSSDKKTAHSISYVEIVKSSRMLDGPEVVMK